MGTHYLPFQLVINDNKSTPVRIVYDGSAKSCKTNSSINDCLFKGVNLLNDLFGMLLRFWWQPVAIVADIEKAFLQIDLQESERNYLRFVWIDLEAWQRGEVRLVVLHLKRVPFGIISSPFILAAVVIHHLRTHQSMFTDFVIANLYVDNLVVAVPNVAYAQQLFTKIVSVFRGASMNLRAWGSNSTSFCTTVPTDLQDSTPVVSILGLQWNKQADTLAIVAPPVVGSGPLTMRAVLRDSARVFDPLGWCAPVTVRAKLLLQCLHQCQCKWDKELTSDKSAEWRHLAADLAILSTVALPRYIGSNPKQQVRLHCFADASKHAYAAAVYLQKASNTVSGASTVHLLVAKARVTPLRFDSSSTIPRLELMGALVAVCLRHQRSTVVAVGRNRASYNLAGLQILATPNLEFRYVPSVDNVADLPTRASSTNDLVRDHRWWHGPDWLAHDTDAWPLHSLANLTLAPEMPENDDRQSSRMSLVLTKNKPHCPFDIDAGQFESFDHLLRVTTYAVHFVQKITCGLRGTRTFNFLLISSFRSAELLWLRAVQGNAFPELFVHLEEQHTAIIPLVRQLRPFVDNQGIICCSGRFHHAPLNNDAKCPILLPTPKDERFVFLLIMWQHVILQHVGPQHTLPSLRACYWFFSRGHQQVYAVLRRCPACARKLALPYFQPQHADLPSFRLDPTESLFTYVGLDMCGPFLIRAAKKYVLLVTCLVTRAVAFEDTDSLESQHIFATLRLIFARRGQPKFFVSDNMRQFTLMRSHIQANATETITWKFIPAYSPWMGGAYERLVGTFKSAFYRSIRANPVCGPVQFRTLVAEIEAAVNTRPLTYVGAKIGDAVLTPNHFLRMRYPSNLVAVPMPASSSAAAAALLEISYYIEEQSRQFWEIWTTLYLQFLRERVALPSQPQRHTTHPPTVNDIVIIREKNMKRAQWRLGQITELCQSDDGCVQAAAVRLANRNVIIKPVKDLYQLELSPPQYKPLVSATTVEAVIQEPTSQALAESITVPHNAFAPQSSSASRPVSLPLPLQSIDAPPPSGERQRRLSSALSDGSYTLESVEILVETPPET